MFEKLLADLTTDELIELLYYIEELALDREVVIYEYAELDPHLKAIFVNTDSDEASMRKTILKFLNKSEEDSIKLLYQLYEKNFKRLYPLLQNIKLKNVFKLVKDDTFVAEKYTIPVKVKQLDIGDIDKISSIDIDALREQLENIEIKVGDKGALKASTELKLKKPIKISGTRRAAIYKARIANLTNKLNTNIKSRLNATILAGIKKGETVNQISKRIRNIYKGPIGVKVAPRYIDGKLVRAGYEYNIKNKRWADMVARTETSWAANQGRIDTYKESGLVKNVRWIVATNPCPDCAIMEGQVLELYEAENMIPYHVHCKCTWVVNSYKEPKEKLPEPPTQFSDEIYTHPDGVGVADIMRMSPGQEKMFNRALELGSYKQAEKILRHHHTTLVKLNAAEFKPGVAEAQWVSSVTPSPSVVAGKISISNKFTKAEKDTIEWALEGLPEKVKSKSYLRKILKGTEKEWNDMVSEAMRFRYGMQANARYGTVKIYANVQKDKYFIKENLIHEWAHLKDAGHRYSTSRAFNDVVVKEGFVSTYSKKRYLLSEDFAESVKFYINSPEKLKIHKPLHYEYINNLFQKMKHIIFLDIIKVIAEEDLIKQTNYFNEKRELVDKKDARYIETVYYNKEKEYIKSRVVINNENNNI